MTEAEWLVTSDIDAIVAHVAGLDPRKVRLFVTACVRPAVRRWGGFGGFYGAALDANERYADDSSARDVVGACRRRVGGEWRRLSREDHDEFPHYWHTSGAMFAALEPVIMATLVAVRMARGAAADGFSAEFEPGESWVQRQDDALDAQLRLARDIFGNPFRPVTFAPDWRTSNAVGVAQAMYAAREFADAPILADALEDAGCDHGELFAHLRGPGEHVRGCWAVDLVLGKA